MIDGFALLSADPDRLAGFYRDALGFVDDPAGAPGLPGAAVTRRLRLGRQRIALVRFDPPGAPYPPGSSSHDGWFQHLALVATDIDAAHARLAARDDFQPISRGTGPVRLPAASGGVRAFKFRDPEGHPLELLQFPADGTPPAWRDAAGGPLVGIDHSAIVVRDVERSVAFYAGLGFAETARSENHGPEQDALDGADAVRVSVCALSLEDGTPHLELLGYHAPPVRGDAAAPRDIAATRTLLGGASGERADPDGHLLAWVAGAS